MFPFLKDSVAINMTFFAFSSRDVDIKYLKILKEEWQAWIHDHGDKNTEFHYPDLHVVVSPHRCKAVSRPADPSCRLVIEPEVGCKKPEPVEGHRCFENTAVVATPQDL
jgi:hypothetical protein